MKYRVNKDFVSGYDKKRREGLSLNLSYMLRERDGDGDLFFVREGNAKDIDGIVSILLEYGVLEEVDSDDEALDDDDLATATDNKIHYFELLRDKINQEIVQLINSNKKHKEDISFEGLTSDQFNLMKNSIKHYEKIINQINSERDDLLHMLKSPYYTYKICKDKLKEK